MNRTVKDLLAALKPRGYVNAWVPIVRVDNIMLSSHRIRVAKTDLIDDLKKLPAATLVRFQVREWTYDSINTSHRFRVRWITLGTDLPDEIEPKHERERR